MLKKDTNLIPNSVSTNTFKQGHTLHSLLCGASHSPKSAGAAKVASQENANRSRIPMYKSLHSSASSKTPMMEQNPKIDNAGPRRKLNFLEGYQNIGMLNSKTLTFYEKP